MVRRTTLLLTLPERVVDAEDRQLGNWRRLLAAYDYRRQLERGYSVTRGADGTVVRSVTGLEPGTELTTRVSDGEVRSVVAAVGEIAVHDQGGTPR
jgi:exonuclease VII large subunit